MVVLGMQSPVLKPRPDVSGIFDRPLVAAAPSHPYQNPSWRSDDRNTRGDCPALCDPA